MNYAYTSLMLKGKPCIVVEPINEHQFDTIQELQDLVDGQNLAYGILTRSAWSKYESLLLSPEELSGMMK